LSSQFLLDPKEFSGLKLRESSIQGSPHHAGTRSKRKDRFSYRSASPRQNGRQKSRREELSKANVALSQNQN